MVTKFTKPKVYKRSIGRRCMHCGRSATVVSSWRTGNGFKVNVRYCIEHADQFIGIINRDIGKEVNHDV